MKEILTGMLANETALLFLSVCAGALLWAILIVVKKKYLDVYKVNEDVVVVATLTGASVACLTAEVLMHAYGNTEVNNAVWLPLLVTAILNVGIQYWGVLALKHEDASVVAPLSATMPFWVIFLSFRILGEWPTEWGLIGIFLVGVGAYLVRLEPGKVPAPKWVEKFFPTKLVKPIEYFLGPWIRLFSSFGARLALLTALLGAVSVNFDKLAVVNSSPMFQTAGAFIFVSLFVYLWSRWSGKWQTLDKKMFWPLFKWGLVLGGANILMNSGYYFGLASYVGSLKRTQILWVVILSGLLLKEKNVPMRLLASALIFLGALAMMF